MAWNKEYSNPQRAAYGEHNAFRSLYMKYFPKMKYFITHMVKSEAVADELTQDIFLKIWENWGKLPDIHSINAYLYRMAKHAAINHLEHKYIEDRYCAGYIWTNPSTSTNPEEEIEAKELEFLIRLTVERMPEQRRTIYVMSRIENVKNSKIAEILGISEKTVNNQLSLALKEIRKIVMLALLFFS